MRIAPAQLDERDDRRHRPAGGARGRDSLFFNVILPDEQLGVFIYTWTDHRGTAGRLVAVWGPGDGPLAMEADVNVAMGDADFDHWRVSGLEVSNREPLRTAEVRFRGEHVNFAYDFTGVHPPFAYSHNAGGCPQWMAQDRFEQTGRAQGELTVAGRTVPFDRPAHRDHSWGPRAWAVPQHWKWIVAQAPSGAALNAMFWLARGEAGLNGYVLRDGLPVPITGGTARAEYEDNMTQRRLVAEIIDASGATTALTMERFGLIPMSSAEDTAVYEAACLATIDGETGSGQFEALWPNTYLQALARDTS